ncbi:MAG: ABC transporter permease [Desulfovibrionaceae bacterium]|nr:ABC transporter permease [Desulfovibrionaceae bacterium]
MSALQALATLPRLFPLACTLCRQDLTERFAGALLGTCWIFIWPIVQLFIYIVIFGSFMGARLGVSGDAHIYSYGIYVAAGLLSWTCFANTLARTNRFLIEKRSVITKVAVDLRVFPLAIAFSETIPFVAGLILLILADCCSGWSLDFGFFVAMAVTFIAQQTLAMGVGLLLACLAAFIRDTIEACAVALQMAFWFTPIVYHPSILPAWVQKVLLINPMTHVVHIFQQFFVFGGSVSLTAIALLLITGMAALLLGLHTLVHSEQSIRDIL